jgi:two-component system, LuxR family, sensor kinase FixL
VAWRCGRLIHRFFFAGLIDIDSVILPRKIVSNLMPYEPSSKSKTPNRATPVILAVSIFVALAVFAIHILWNNQISISILYVVALLICATLENRTTLLALGAFCGALLVVGFVWGDGPPYSLDSIARSAICLLTIVVTTVMLLGMENAKRALQSQARLLDQAHDSIFVRRLDGRVVFWNRGAEALFEWPRAMAVGRTTDELIQARYPSSKQSAMDELLKNDRWEGDVVYKTRSGKLLTVASRWSLQRDERGRPRAIIETDNDVTATRRAQNELVEAQSNLQHVTRISTLGELTTSIAHEIKQPLSAIVTHGEACLRWIDRGEGAKDEMRDAISWMIRDGRRAAEVIDNLRSLSKKHSTHFQTIDAKALVDGSLVLLAHEIAKHNVILSLDVPDNLPPVNGDLVALQQVLINLFVNAIQAMADVPEMAHRLSVRVRAKDVRELLIEVSDTGCGLGEIRHELFDAFFTTKRNGMGMGLSICRSIIEQHGGRIWASSNDWGGATFHFLIPTLGAAR